MRLVDILAPIGGQLAVLGDSLIDGGFQLRIVAGEVIVIQRIVVGIRRQLVMVQTLQRLLRPLIGMMIGGLDHGDADPDGGLNPQYRRKT